LLDVAAKMLAVAAKQTNLLNLFPLPGLPRTLENLESQGKNIGPGKSGKVREFFARPWIFYVGNELPRKGKLA